MEITELIVNHLVAVRKIPGLESATIVFVPESNLAFEGIRVSHELRRSGIRDICVMQEDDNRAGIKTNNDLKKAMAISFQKVLAKRRIKFHKKMVCLTQVMGLPVTPDDMMEDIRNQLLDFKRIIKPSKDPYKPSTEIYSGKRGCHYDDLVVALTLNKLMQARWKKSTKYDDWRSRTIK